MSDLREQRASLSVDEKVELLDEICESPEDDVSLTDAQRIELDARIAQLEQNPDDVIPWEDVRARLLEKR